jgi:hypothetical protein
MAQNQPRGFRVTCDLPDYSWGRVQRVFGADSDGHVQDEQVGAACELGKAGIGAGLIRPEHDRVVPNADPVRECWDVSMRNTKRGHDQAVAFQDRGGLVAGGINNDDLEPRHATSATECRATRTSECRSQHPEHAGLLIAMRCALWLDPIRWTG